MIFASVGILDLSSEYSPVATMRPSSISRAASSMIASLPSSVPTRGRGERARVTSWPMLRIAVAATLPPRHWDVYAFFAGGLLRQFIAGVSVPGYADAGIVVEDAGDLACGEIGPVGHRDLAGVEREAHAHAAAVVEADPGCAGCGVEQCVEDGPICNCVRAVEHLFG